MRPREEILYVFAARYAHGRSTGAAWTVVGEIKIAWPELSEYTKGQLIEESHEAAFCLEDWQELRDFAEENQ